MQKELFDPEYWYHPLTRDKLKVIIRYKMRLGFPFISFLLFYLAVFEIIEHWNRLHYTVIHSWVDDTIPFCEIFVIPYFLWFVYVFGTCIYLFLVDEKSYHEVATFLSIGMGFFLIVSIFFPNILMIRPETMPRENLFTKLVQFLYSIDTPTNVTPSIHVYDSIGIMIAMWHTDAGKFHSRTAKILMDVQGFLIILATMFIKQHSFSDVVVGTGFAIILYIVVYRMGFVLMSRKRREMIYESVIEDEL